MAFTALEQVRIENQKRFGPGVGPKAPEFCIDPDGRGLKAMALRFLSERCEGLLLDPERGRAEREGGVFLGKSFQPNQIPYDMEMDLNRLCFVRELEKFLDSGTAEDAYSVYYCFLNLFFGPYGKSKRMVELLSEYESNGSSLLMKHRDHYSHSVYVFALGLAVYESNPAYRAAFKRFYGFDEGADNASSDHRAACCFLEFWGLTSLFHDIGYPFELPFEQVMSYFEVEGKERGKGSLYLAYHDLDPLTKLGEEAKKHFETLYGRSFETTDALLAGSLFEKLGAAYGFEEQDLLETIQKKPTSPNAFGYFMDHAYFSAARLYREVERAIGIEGIRKEHVDALTAILLHNSLFKFAIAFYKDPSKRKDPLPMDLHPLAWLLMLSDELQCWDRTAYGRNSRTELHPMGASFEFSERSIRAEYVYDAAEQEKIRAYEEAYRAWEESGKAGKAPRLKAFSDMAEPEERFLTDIEKIVDLREYPLTVTVKTEPADRKNKHTYLSSSNFLHLYDFAVALNARYSYPGQEAKAGNEAMERDFEALSLEYQLSNVNQAKSFSRYLDAIGCFFTDRPVDYEMVTAFTDQEIAVFAPLEHLRWVREHRAMGWQAGDKYETAELPETLLSRFGDERAARKALRELLRMHKLAMAGDPADEAVLAHYLALPEAEKKKDYEPFNSMLKLIRKYDGLRIYRLNERTERA